MNIGYQKLYASRSSMQSLKTEKGSQLLTHGRHGHSFWGSGTFGKQTHSSYGKAKWNPCMSKAIYIYVSRVFLGIPPMMFRTNSPNDCCWISDDCLEVLNNQNWFYPINTGLCENFSVPVNPWVNHLLSCKHRQLEGIPNFQAQPCIQTMVCS